jgi:hypothetical protein
VLSKIWESFALVASCIFWAPVFGLFCLFLWITHGNKGMKKIMRGEEGPWNLK